MKYIDRQQAQDAFIGYDEYNFAYYVLDEVPTIEAIPIPKRATNGDMIKATFGDVRIWQPDSYHMAVEFKDALCIKLFEIKWWNAPYRAESEDKE